ncbi:MAG: adenylosuccinate synthetase, partial [Planctomycetes bacterium]|nr:adenylosuccinate synthetase [Planctomycetota bacterium]
RPRRCGWFDAHAVRAMAKLGRMNALCITKMDVLAGLGELSTGVGYAGWDSAGLPASHRIYETLSPRYEQHAGFEGELAPIREWDAMPEPVKAYINRLEEVCGVPVKYFSTGPATDELVIRA